MIHVKDLFFSYGQGDFSLRIAELNINDGESVAVTGSSGSGKTTLLNLIAGIALPASGRIETNGVDIASLSESDRRKFRISAIGLVFQEFELLEYLTVLDNILLPFRVSRALPLTPDVRGRALALADEVEIADKLARYPDQLSQGERQRDSRAACRSGTAVMSDVLYLAWRYIAYHRIKTGILIASIMLIVYLPVGLNVLMDESAEQLTARAGATPLLVGARGSPLELALNSLYFESDTPALTGYAEAERIGDSGLATPIPLSVRFRSRGQPIVGTTLDYFEFRGLSLAEGRMMATLGEAVIGATVAQRLSLGAGDAVVSSPETVFDLAGVYPLKTKITGVLAPNFSPDDEAIFVDVKTAWIMEGLGHGHQELASPEVSSAVLSREGNRIVANASVVQYNEITEENIDSFHFHGDNAEFPLSAVMAVPVDQKSGVLLMGRYQGESDASQIIEPLSVIEELLETVVSIQQFVVAAVVIVGLATVATAALVFMLSLRLRRREIDTMFKIGASRIHVSGTLVSEVIVVLVLAVLLAAVLTVLTSQYGTDLIENLILS